MLTLLFLEFKYTDNISQIVYFLTPFILFSITCLIYIRRLSFFYFRVNKYTEYIILICYNLYKSQPSSKKDSPRTSD